MGIEPLVLTRLFYWLGEVLFWKIDIKNPFISAKKGFIILGEKQDQNLEAALMNQLVAIGCSQLGDHEKFIDFTQQMRVPSKACLTQKSMRTAYDHIIGLYAYT